VDGVPDEMKPDAVLSASDGLIAQARAIDQVGWPIEVGTTIPEDHFELAALLDDLERHRFAFDGRLAEGLRAGGTKLAEVALAVLAADELPPAVTLPAAVREGTP
jgi:hypothetical protein